MCFEYILKDIVVNVNIKSGIYWFLNIFPQIILNDDIVDNKQKIQPYFTIQKAGDIVFVPCDWYHVVINLENTVAITHNFAMKRDVNKIIPRVFRDEPTTPTTVPDHRPRPPSPTRRLQICRSDLHICTEDTAHTQSHTH